MKRFGSFLAIAGIASAIFSFMNSELIIFAWIGTWGPTVAWVIRIAAIVIGGLMWMMGRNH